MTEDSTFAAAIGQMDGAIRPKPQPTNFNVTSYTPIRWLAKGLIEQSTVNILSADVGAGKSLAAQALTVAVLRGGVWLGANLERGRVVYIDNENHPRIAEDRLRAFGMEHDDQRNLRYFVRSGIQLTEDWLWKEIHAFKPALVVIDTVSSTANVDLNSNTNVGWLYANRLRPLANLGCCVELLTHERKLAHGERQQNRDQSQATMGARQWIAQADGHLALQKIGNTQSVTRPDLGVGYTQVSFTVEVSDLKDRDGMGSTSRQWTVDSVRNGDGPRGRLVSMEFVPHDDLGDMERKVLAVFASMGVVELRQGEIAKALMVERNAKPLETALKKLVKKGKLAHEDRGPYRLV